MVFAIIAAAHTARGAIDEVTSPQLGQADIANCTHV
jgi:hypothetical protein